jgi:REP element-mobilizing transposase RayT
MNRVRRGEKIFTTKEDYWSFFGLLEELNEVFNVKIAAYCLMANHYHLLVQTPDANLSRSMIKGSSPPHRRRVNLRLTLLAKFRKGAGVYL